MSSLEVQIINAVQNGDISQVRTLIEKGANINVFTSGKTPLGVAARQGNVAVLELLINCGRFKKNQEKSKKKSHKNEQRLSNRSVVKKRKALQGNNGYYEVIYDDKSDESETDNEQNVSLDDVTTPEGMDSLEWDSELEGEDDSVFEDAWSDQYRWYAKILANAAHTASDLSYSCDLNLQDSVGRCAIHYAAENGHVNAVKVLLNAGCKVDIGDVDSLTPLHLAANGGHLSVVETLLLSSCNVNAKTTDKMSPLHYAAVKGYTKVVTALLDARATIDCLDEGERTPLFLAASRNLPDVAEVLVKRGARVNIEDVKGYTALCEAVWHKSVPMAKMLLEAGAKVVPTHFLIHYAVLHRHYEMVTALLEAGALVNVRDSHENTPLVTAIVTGQIEMVNLLIKFGANVNYIGASSGKTPLFCAIASSEKECPEVVRTLVEAGADMEKLTWGHTPLATALIYKKIKIAVTLLALGAEYRPSFYPFLVMINSITLARAIISAGYDINKVHDRVMRRPTEWPVEPKTGCPWTNIKFSPLSLAELCRIEVRSQATGPLFKYIHNLQIPPIITRYLMLEDVVNSVESSIEELGKPRVNLITLSDGRQRFPNQILF